MQRSVTVFPNRDAVVGAAILATLRAMLVSSRRSELEEAGIIGFSMSTYYELRSGPAPWGDYGYELWNGFTEESEERDQPAILVSRTGPFVAPITVSFGRILVTEDFRRKLVAERFGSFIRARWVQEGRPHAWERGTQMLKCPPSIQRRVSPRTICLKGLTMSSWRRPCRTLGVDRP